LTAPFDERDDPCMAPAHCRQLAFAAGGMMVVMNVLAHAGCVVRTSSAGVGGNSGPCEVCICDGICSPSGATTGTGGCQETGTRHCASCFTDPPASCGPPSLDVDLLCCNDTGQGKSSLGLYTPAYGCICGADGKSGQCGAACSKACLGVGSNPQSCGSCFTDALAGACKSVAASCAADK
jgi:hypothetical protein